MQYVSLLKARRGDSKETLMRRASWSYPEGLRLIAEYWMNAGSLMVIAVYEADDLTVVHEITSKWSDIFEITTATAIPVEKAMRFAERLAMEDLGVPRAAKLS